MPGGRCALTPLGIRARVLEGCVSHSRSSCLGRGGPCLGMEGAPFLPRQGLPRRRSRVGFACTAGWGAALVPEMGSQEGKPLSWDQGDKEADRLVEAFPAPLTLEGRSPSDDGSLQAPTRGHRRRGVRTACGHVTTLPALQPGHPSDIPGLLCHQRLFLK